MSYVIVNEVFKSLVSHFHSVIYLFLHVNRVDVLFFGCYVKK